VTTLLTVKIGQDAPRRCDAKCYESTSAKCDCVCGGKNHGAGLSKAIDNTRELAESWIERIAVDRGIPAAAVLRELHLPQGALL